MSRFPDFYLVGAPKCGTTAFYDFLSQHPQLYLPRAKELLFFGTDLSYPSRLTEQEFLRHFDGRSSEELAGTAHTAYLQSARAAAEISEKRPDAKILILLRNPVEMLHSWHSELLYETIENIENFESALNAEPDRRRGIRIPAHARNSHVEALYYTEVAAFYNQVKRYLDAFGNSGVHVMVQEELLAHPHEVYFDALAFLGVDTSFVPIFRPRNTNKVARVRWLQHASYAVAFPGHRAMRRILPKPVRKAILSLNTHEAPRGELAPRVRVRLENLFRSDVAHLELLLGRKLWNFDSSQP